MAAIGTMTQVEPFVTYLGWSMAGIGATCAAYLAYRLMQFETMSYTLRVNEKTLSFHSGRVPITLFWREVFGIDVSSATDPASGLVEQRVVIRGRKAGTREQDLEAFPLDFRYGLPAEDMAQILRHHWHSASTAARAAAGPQYASLTPAAGAPSFGRRATDRPQ